MVVFRGDEDVAVERGDLRRPGLGVVLAVLPGGRRHRLVEQGQVLLGDVDQLELGIGTLAGVLIDPVGHGRAGAAGAGAAENDRDFQHGGLLHSTKAVQSCSCLRPVGLVAS
jgi:hypothetical protein